MLRVRPTNRDAGIQAARRLEPPVPDLPQPRPSPDEPVTGRQFVAGGRIVFFDDPQREVQLSELSQCPDPALVEDPDDRRSWIWDFPSFECE